MGNTVSLSQGNTFACTFAWAPGASGPANLLTTEVTSSIEDCAKTVYELDVAIAIDGLSFEVTYDGNTALWELGLARWDIKFVFASSGITRSEIFRVNIIDSVTE